MKKIFLDVGAHNGETALVAMESQYAFDRICCFEPSQKCLNSLQTLSESDSRIEIYQFGLGADDRQSWLLNSGDLGASIIRNQLQTLDPNCELVEIRDIVDWITLNINVEDFVVMKINCEGAEVEIIERLLESNKLNFFYSIVISWDIRDHKAYAHREAELRKKLRGKKVTNCCSSDDVLIGETHSERIRNWLSLFGINRHDFDKILLQKEFSEVFLKYSRKSGFFSRIEHRLKIWVCYENMPIFVRASLRGFKRLLGMNRDRKVKIN